MGGKITCAGDSPRQRAHTLWHGKRKEERTNISKTSPLNLNTVETIATRLAASSAAEQKKPRRFILFYTVMNICVFSEWAKKSVQSVRVLHTFPCWSLSNGSLFPWPGVWGSLWAQWRVSMVWGERSERMQAAGQCSRSTPEHCYTTPRESTRTCK